MTQNIDQNEVNKFAEIAEKWWDPTGDFKPLHVINPLRANYINKKSPIDGLKVLDVGCGGGLLAEALDAKGAKVTAKVIEHLKGDKVIVFMKKRRKGYKVKNGFRQFLTKLEILSIDEKTAKVK